MTLVERLRRFADDRGDWQDSDMARRAADEIERLQALATWRPIETAPKDEALIMVHDGRKYVICRADDLQYKPPYLDGATHWMPLPAPPSEPAKETK